MRMSLTKSRRLSWVARGSVNATVVTSFLCAYTDRDTSVRCCRTGRGSSNSWPCWRLNFVAATMNGCMAWKLACREWRYLRREHSHSVFKCLKMVTVVVWSYVLAGEGFRLETSSEKVGCDFGTEVGFLDAVCVFGECVERICESSYDGVDYRGQCSRNCSRVASLMLVAWTSRMSWSRRDGVQTSMFPDSIMWRRRLSGGTS